MRTSDPSMEAEGTYSTEEHVGILPADPRTSSVRQVQMMNAGIGVMEDSFSSLDTQSCYASHPWGYPMFNSISIFGGGDDYPNTNYNFHATPELSGRNFWADTAEQSQHLSHWTDWCHDNRLEDPTNTYLQDYGLSEHPGLYPAIVQLSDFRILLFLKLTLFTVPTATI